jgi:hypothetical protein
VKKLTSIALCLFHKSRAGGNMFKPYLCGYGHSDPNLRQYKKRKLQRPRSVVYLLEEEEAPRQQMKKAALLLASLGPAAFP